MECRVAVHINDNLFNRLSRVRGEKVPPDVFRPFLDGIKRIDADLFKDPRFTKDPRIVDVWTFARKDFSFLYLYRRPEEIFESTKTAGHLPIYGPGHRTRVACVNEIKRRRERFLSNLNKLAVPYEEILFPVDFSPDIVLQKLSLLGVDLPLDRAREVWSRTFVSPGVPVPVPGDLKLVHDPRP